MSTASRPPRLLPALAARRFGRLVIAAPAMALLLPPTLAAATETVTIDVEMDGEHFVAWGRANVRALPAGDAEVLQRLEFGDRLFVTGAVSGSDWVRVETDDVPVGYVWGAVLQPVQMMLAGPGGQPVGPGISGANSPDTAISLGLLADQTVTRTGSVGSANEQDYYRFTLDGWTMLTVDMDQLTSDVDIELLDSGLNQLAYSVRAGSEPENISTLLDAGDYYLRVYIFSGESPYRLSVNAAVSDGPPSEFAGDTPDSATDLGVLDESAIATEGWVSVALNPNDYYRIELPQRSALQLTLTGLMADADLTLEDDFGSVIDSSMYGGTEDERIERRLDPGVYFVRVNAFTGQTPYVLSAEATPAGPAQPGETAGSPIELPAMADWPAVLDDYLDLDERYYAFDLDRPERVRIEMQPFDTDLDIEVMEAASRNVLAMSTYGGTMAEQMSVDLAPGRYLIRLWQFGGPSGYSLRVGLEADMAPTKPGG